MDANEVAARLLDDHGGRVEAAGQPTWLQVRVDAAGRLLSRRRPEPEGWLGHDLPAGWEAAAVVATGRAHSTEPGHELPESVARARHGGLRLCCLVTRSGRVGWKVQLPTPPWASPPAPGVADAEAEHPLAVPPSEGMMLDVLLRAVGRPTPPPSSPAGDMITLLWVEAILRAGEEGAQSEPEPRWRARWSDVIGMHPALPLDADTDPNEAESLLAVAGAWATWEDFRRRAAVVDSGDRLPRAALAAWMDEGMFSRWVMDGLPTIEQALRLVRPLVDPDAYHRFRRIARTHHPVDSRTYVR